MGAAHGGPPGAAEARGGAGDGDRQGPEEGGGTVSVAGAELHTRPPQPALRLVGLDQRRPCWHCSRALGRARGGQRRGQYVGAAVVDGGYERVVHVACARAMEEG